MHSCWYRVIQSSWGIAVYISGEAVPRGEHQGPAVEIHPLIALADESHVQHDRELAARLEAGLRLAAPYIARQGNLSGPIVIRIARVLFSESDFQPEGLSAAAIAWCAGLFQLAPPHIPVTYDREKKVYRFDFQALSGRAGGGDDL